MCGQNGGDLDAGGGPESLPAPPQGKPLPPEPINRGAVTPLELARTHLSCVLNRATRHLPAQVGSRSGSCLEGRRRLRRAKPEKPWPGRSCRNGAEKGQGVVGLSVTVTGHPLRGHEEDQGMEGGGGSSVVRVELGILTCGSSKALPWPCCAPRGPPLLSGWDLEVPVRPGQSSHTCSCRARPLPPALPSLPPCCSFL